MNKFRLSLSILLLTLVASIQAGAALLGSPYLPEIDARFNAIENYDLIPQGIALQIQNVSGSTASLVIPANGGGTGFFNPVISKTVFNPSGGTIAIGSYTSSPTVFGAFIPPKSIIKQAWIYVNQTIIGSSNLAINCLGGAANTIFSAANFSGNAVGSIVAGVEVGTAATMLQVVTGCTPQFTVSGSLGGGTLELYIEYVPYQ